MANIHRWQRGAKLVGRRITIALALAVAASLLAMLGSTSSLAATTGGYPTALVEFQASTRTQPYLNNTYWGYALRDPWSGGRQTVSVKCWYDGDWATGNYTTNRWFRVLVWENYDGYNTPRWLFVHASYVYNQPGVPMCIRYPTGVE